ncbi:phosphatidylserine decarboxylase family protein [Endozoicomonas montiporae]|uniref:Phosphatidylserine decarboxylase n=1 Tax=Endozoicomonas montiporae CL-33 TaxID=570277 RepID=A0A142B7U9_9GAMM|nr:phosphatidylserine decarboxylase family protein [Endozoicomonas montiporae]AMO54825.1 phosphatidylserine decarboxylase [Endozoicomonas montiporae CL-33]
MSCVRFIYLFLASVIFLLLGACSQKQGEQRPQKTHPGQQQMNSSISTTKDPVQMGFWVPNKEWATAKYLVPLRDSIAQKKANNQLPPLQPEVAEFKDWITSHSVYRMWLTSMIDDSNAYVRSLDSSTKQKIRSKDGNFFWIESYDSFFEVLNEIITTTPSFNDTLMVGTPLNSFLAIAMGTESGVALFHDATFNKQFKKVLNTWNAYLKSNESLDKLDINNPEKDGSWISKEAWKAGVWDQMVHDKTKPGYGYHSWNAFFTRKFVPGARPFMGNAATDINIGCETVPWQYQDNVALESKFWIKDAHYSLLDLFGGEKQWAELFEGGQIYQGFLSATHYHRWNAPLDGELVRSWVQPGTYFAQRIKQKEGPVVWDDMVAQPYLGHVAARAIFIFKHKTAGYVALISIGMVEVSTTIIEPDLIVDEDSLPIKITRGTEIGHFEFGGSTHIMVFQKDKVKLVDWAMNATKHRNDPKPTPLGSTIATVIAQD